MQFDLFHSLGRIDSTLPNLSDRDVFTGFFQQVQLAEELGFDTVWVAESHFSSEVQKMHREPVIPHYHGEVGLNCDSMQLFQFLHQLTKRINFGTAIMNIVGGNGGPIAAADRIQTLAFLNALQERPRQLHIGVAAGRFPYINAPFGITPRNDIEREHWPAYKRLIFLEALEIFLRLVLGETIASDDIQPRLLSNTDIPYHRRWSFEALKLVPEISGQAREQLQFVLGSHDPLARELALSITDVDVFNLSFTPPEQLLGVHRELESLCQDHPERRTWHRRRLPRTVLVFIDQDQREAERHASQCFDTYIEAMRGTVSLPPKEVLMARALIGTPDRIYRQMFPLDGVGFDQQDRLMLWFEFNQANHERIAMQMQLFADEVMTRI